ncbi:chemotaxis protein CheX [Sulfoacidibacillus ferrooxidans]|uniref:Chemotaxis phosphatase CheX-like domain-containing protein n=1 Tax=Sulfoacidibacillus ferrooxidans TaxID=2005001 RepID=A0A9X2ACR3_9BACL|nr:chemotaxis protein CheX [Sulfoacidibacillus ferrooxidans]MCI0184463.1 hypothetical protein [Sulfoacidibacillus ferrooxidans]
MDNQQIFHLINGAIETVNEVIPVPLTRQQARRVASPLQQHDLGVLVSFLGDIKGQLIYMFSNEYAKQFSKEMFEMELEGDMLDSFVGELGNMLSGNWATRISATVRVEIAPPVVLKGSTQLSTTASAFLVPFLGSYGEFQMYVLVDS